MYNLRRPGTCDDDVDPPPHMQMKLSVGLVVGEVRQRAEQNLAHLLAQDALGDTLLGQRARTAGVAGEGSAHWSIACRRS